MKARAHFDNPTGGWDSSAERLQHDIEELERGSGWRGFLRGFVILAIAVGIGAAIYFGSDRTPPKVVKTTATGGIVLETIEPLQGKLGAVPTRFRWESVMGRADCTFRVFAKGEPLPLVDRVVAGNSVELTADEANRLAKGRTYIWEAQARAKDGKVLGTGRGVFEL